MNLRGHCLSRHLDAHNVPATSRSYMSPLDLSSLKWGDDGELSPNDTLSLVERLATAEEMSQGADQSSLNSSSIPQEEPSQDS